MLQITKRLTKRFLLATALVAAGGLALGSASTAEARGCGYGGGYGYGGWGYGGFGPRPVVVARPVVAVPPRALGYGNGFHRGFNRGGGFYGAGYRGGGFYGGRGVSIGFGF